MRKLYRFLFSRYTLSAIVILLSLGLMWAFLSFMSAYSFFFYILLTVVDVLVVVAIINREANPEYKLPWLFIALIVPVFGAVLYIIFYSRKLSAKETKLLRKIHVLASAASSRVHAEKQAENLALLSEESEMALGKVRAILTGDPSAELYRCTESRYYPLGELMYKDMLSDIESAKKYIFLEYFIIEEGVMWGGILEGLRKKANEGVDVRVLYDDIGCMKTLPARFPKTLEELGIKCRRFAEVTPRVSAMHNNRDHRKILAIDGRIAYTGGINIADEYINEVERFGHWKDGGVRVFGDAAVGFTKLFLSAWDFTVGCVSNYSDYFEPNRESFSADGGFYVPFGTGPMPIYSRPVGKDIIINLINQAERYVYITTPYLIIDYALTDAFKCAAQRGVDVRIVTPAIPDKKNIKVMTKSSYPNLMESGVRIFEYLPGFIHEKVMVVDDLYAVVGTINLDYRSLVHHFEDGLWMYNTETVIRIKEEFVNTVSVCDEIDGEEAKLTFSERLMKVLIRLFAPLL